MKKICTILSIIFSANILYAQSNTLFNPNISLILNGKY
jgi:hypothetical protein